MGVRTGDAIVLTRLYKALVWRARLTRDLVCGGAPRHRALAEWRGLRLRRQCRQRVRVMGRVMPQRPIILVGMIEHMGDIVAAEPISRHLRETEPEAHLIWAVRSAFRELIDHNPHVNEVLLVGCMTEWINLLNGRVFGRVVDLHVEDRFCSICNVPLKKRSGNRSLSIRNYYNHGNLLSIACQCGDLPPVTDGPRVYIPDDVRRYVDVLSLPREFVAIHAKSNQDVRDWEERKWHELVEQLSNEGMPVVEVGLSPVIRRCTRDHINLCGQLSILETAEVIRRARLFIGIDSGPAHLANAVAAPGVILLGHYRSYQRYMPYSGGYADGSNARIIYGDGPAASIGVEQVLSAVRGALARPVTEAERVLKA
jgi:heptosyltransferase III